ncbi:uncharacterized protein PV09_02148 [Verruconis gallopava]|uniref:Uncharacterized protein n=1 Tax=Verruconis gallopava TaxID=253628 RepID=A0A0D2AKB9_9PEZI|nr:uncharacterized protein PV09_02148 [Verruconis gallopava]KIW07298.1 hypothetical protein PV09_02148 [Verruconis gallopava]
MALTAPFHSAMRLGQGFNSYTQELRLDGAMKIVTSNQASPDPFSRRQPQTFGAISSTNQNAFEIVPASGPPEGQSGEHNDSVSREEAKKSVNGSTVSIREEALRSQEANKEETPRFVLPPGEPINSNQSVTFSTRSISNMSDIMDALNISASMSIKYGTIHGNGSASFVNEDKVLDSQLNYLISVRVNNNDVAEIDEIIFSGLEHITPDKFTEVYGDCFIAGFQTGGEFNAIISIDCHDKSKANGVKEAIDMQLAVPPVPGLEVGGGQGFSKNHSELLRGIEMTISVNWTGGGELKPPGVPWDLKTVMAAANAYPSMVARSSTKISAILRPYTSVPSFVEWQYKRFAEYDKDLKNYMASKTEKDLADPNVAQEIQNLKDARDLWIDKSLILNYAPCQLYTNDLFNAYMQYKKLWKRISFIMSDTKKWRPRTIADIYKDIGKPVDDDICNVKNNENVRPESNRQAMATKPTNLGVITEMNENGSTDKNLPASARTVSKPRDTTPKSSGPSTPVPPTPHVGSISRFGTFPLKDPSIKEEWDLDALNKRRDPISLDPVELNEARLLCREAMTLITEEAYSLVYHPDLAYAEYNRESKKTRMKRPIYMYPEVLKARLPTFVRNDAATAHRSRDPVILKLKQFDDNDLWANLLGDDLNPKWNYKHFVSLERNESNGWDNPIISLSIHAYAHSARFRVLEQWYSDAQGCIGGFGFRFETDKDKPADDGCTQWEGDYQDHDPRLFRHMTLRNPIAHMEQTRERQGEEHHNIKNSIKEMFNSSAHATIPEVKEAEAFKKLDANNFASKDKNIEKIEVFWVPGTGRIAGMVFHDDVGGMLSWKQWEGISDKPAAMHSEMQYPPNDGTRWQFVGLMGNWCTDKIGHNKVLARVSGIWRKT